MNIELDPERLRQVLAYDPETGEFRWRERIARTAVVGEIAGKCNRPGVYRGIQIMGRRYMAHRLAFVFMTGERPLFVDHINGEPSDNRWTNLRHADHQTNQFNAKRAVFNTTGVKNVSFYRTGKHLKRFGVNFRVGGKVKSFGRFSTLVEAAVVAQSIRAKLHGEFARAE
jgi:hypothetical protein